MATNKHGLTLVEIMLVVVIIAMLGATAAGWHLRARERSQSVLCAQIRQQIESAEARYMLGEGEHSSTLLDLASDGYLKNLELCPAGGDYAWIDYSEDSLLYQSTLACSVHGTGSSVEDEPDEPEPRPRPRPVPEPVRPRRRQIQNPEPAQPHGGRTPARRPGQAR